MDKIDLTSGNDEGRLSYENLQKTIDLMKTYRDGDVVCKSDAHFTITAPVESLTVTAPPKKKRRKNMFGKKYEELRERISNVDKTRVDDKQEACRRENRLFSKLEGRIHHLENKVEELIDDSNARARQSIRDTFKSELTDLKAEIHLLKYPQGIVLPKEEWFSVTDNKCTTLYFHYSYANESYIIPDIANNNITGYRKQGEFLQIRWEEEHRVTTYAEEIPTIVEHTKTFLLKDELIPLENCEVKIDMDFVEVEK